MAIYFRQICLVAENLDAVVQPLCEVFGLQICYRDHEVGKFGLENCLLAVGSQFIEVVAPTQPETAAGRFLQRRGGDGGYMVICQVASRAEQAAVRARAAERSVRVAYESDRNSWTIMQLHPRDMGAAFFEVDWDEQANMTGNWQPAGGLGWKDFVSNDCVTKITAIELQSDDPLALAEQWAAVAGVSVSHEGKNPLVSLANINLRFVTAVDGRGAGLSGLDIQTVAPADIIQRAQALGIEHTDKQLTLCGTQFNLVP